MKALAISKPIETVFESMSLSSGGLHQQAVVRAEFGSLTFKREQLSQAAPQRLDFLTGDPQKLAAKIVEQRVPGRVPQRARAPKLDRQGVNNRSMLRGTYGEHFLPQAGCQATSTLLVVRQPIAHAGPSPV